MNDTVAAQIVRPRARGFVDPRRPAEQPRRTDKEAVKLADAVVGIRMGETAVLRPRRQASFPLKLSAVRRRGTSRNLRRATPRQPSSEVRLERGSFGFRKAMTVQAVVIAFK